MVVPKACCACATVPLKLMNVELFATLVMVKPWLVSQEETLARSLLLRPKRAPNCSDVSHW